MNILSKLFGRKRIRNVSQLPDAQDWEVVDSRKQQQASLLNLDGKMFDNPENLEYTVIEVDGDPEKVAEDLMRDSLPKTQIDQIDVSNDEGLSRLLACLMLRRQQASLEKDEIIRFVQRNRKALEAGALDLFKLFADAGSQVEGGEELGHYFAYFMEAVSAALEGRPQEINIKSDRLLWLVYALAQQLSTGRLSYREAVAVLSKPQHKNRISQITLFFMLQDYAEYIGTPHQTPTEYVLLILECAMLSGDAISANAASAILGSLPAPHDPQAFIEVMDRARKIVVSGGNSPAYIDETVRRYGGRFQNKVADDDF